MPETPATAGHTADSDNQTFKLLYVYMCVYICEQARTLLTSLFGWQAAHPTAHGGKSTQVFLQALISLLVQASHGPEFGPVEPAKVWVKNNTKGGNHTVEVSLFSPGPSEDAKKKLKRSNNFHRKKSSTKHILL